MSKGFCFARSNSKLIGTTFSSTAANMTTWFKGHLFISKPGVEHYQGHLFICMKHSVGDLFICVEHYPRSSVKPVFHDGDKFYIAEVSVTIRVKDVEYGVHKVGAQVGARTHKDCPLEILWKNHLQINHITLVLNEFWISLLLYDYKIFCMLHGEEVWKKTLFLTHDIP